MTDRPNHPRVHSAGAFLGILQGLDPQTPGQPMLVTVALPRGEYDAAYRTLGKPDRTLGSNVVLLPSLRPAHPSSDDDAALLAALRFVNRRLSAAGHRPELLHELGVLRAALGQHQPDRDITHPVFSRSAAEASDHVAVLVLDPAGRQLAEAFIALPPDQRSALSRVAQIMADLIRGAA